MTTQDTLLELIRTEFFVTEEIQINGYTCIVDLDLESLELTALQTAVEDKFGVTFARWDAMIAGRITIGALASLIDGHQ